MAQYLSVFDQMLKIIQNEKQTPFLERSDEFQQRFGCTRQFQLQRVCNGLDDPFTVRMESWLPSDTFRRAGFGHVLRGREHALTLERGVSLVWFNRNARSSNPVYAASVYAPGRRYRLSSVSPSLASSLLKPVIVKAR